MHSTPSDTQWSSLPTRLLLAELQRRKHGGEKPECGGRQQGWYDTVSHVFALLLILALSTLGTRGPVTRRKKIASFASFASFASSTERSLTACPLHSMWIPIDISTGHDRQTTKEHHFLQPAHWNGGASRNGLCSLTAHGVRIVNGSVSAVLLQSRIYATARACSHGIGHHGGWRRIVLDGARRGTFALSRA